MCWFRVRVWNPSISGRGWLTEGNQWSEAWFGVKRSPWMKYRIWIRHVCELDPVLHYYSQHIKLRLIKKTAMIRCHIHLKRKERERERESERERRQYFIQSCLNGIYRDCDLGLIIKMHQTCIVVEYFLLVIICYSANYLLPFFIMTLYNNL